MSQTPSYLNDFPFIVLVDEDYWMLDLVLTVLYDERATSQEFENVDALYKSGNMDAKTAKATLEPLFKGNALLEFALSLYLTPEEPIKIPRLFRVELVTFLHAWPHKRSVLVKRFLWRFASTMAEHYVVSRDNYIEIMYERLYRPKIKRSILYRKEWNRHLLTDNRHYQVLQKSSTEKYFIDAELFLRNEPDKYKNFIDMFGSYHTESHARTMTIEESTMAVLRFLLRVFKNKLVLLVRFGNLLPFLKNVGLETFLMVANYYREHQFLSSDNFCEPIALH